MATAIERGLRVMRFALCASLCAACGHADLSLGEIGCAGGNTACAGVDEFLLTKHDVTTAITSEGTAEIVWEASIEAPACHESVCPLWQRAALVDASGDVTAVLVPLSPSGAIETYLWAERFDPNGAKLWQSSGQIVPKFSFAGIDGPAITSVRMFDAADGRIVIVVTSLLAVGVYELDAAGNARVRFEAQPNLYTGGSSDSDQHAATFTGSEVVVASNTGGGNLSGYRPDGALAWRQTALAAPSIEVLVKSRLSGNGAHTLRVLGLEARDKRLWALLQEDTGYGLEKLDANGNVRWHLWQGGGSSTGVFAIDGRDRIIIASGDPIGVERLDFGPDSVYPPTPDVIVTVRGQELFWPPDVASLAIDNANAIYVVTQDGPKSGRRILIDRIEEDFSERRPYVLTGAGHDQNLELLGGPQPLLGANGDLFAFINDAIASLIAPGVVAPGALQRLVRLHLTFPPAMSQPDAGPDPIAPDAGPLPMMQPDAGPPPMQQSIPQ